MADETCKKCGAPITDENKCSCEEMVCGDCCSCEPECTCGCKKEG